MKIKVRSTNSIKIVTIKENFSCILDLGAEVVDVQLWETRSLLQSTQDKLDQIALENTEMKDKLKESESHSLELENKIDEVS